MWKRDLMAQKVLFELLVRERNEQASRCSVQWKSVIYIYMYV